MTIDDTNDSEQEQLPTSTSSKAKAIVRASPQLALQLFFDSPKRPLVDSPVDIGYNKSNQIIFSKSDLGHFATKAIDALHFVARDRIHETDTFDIDLQYFLWLVGMKTRDHQYVKKQLNQAQGETVQVQTYNPDGSESSWVSTQLIGAVGISNGRLHFTIPRALQRTITDPDQYTFLSFRIRNKFSSQYTDRLYQVCMANRYRKETPWMSISELRGIIGATEKTYDTNKYLMRVLNNAINEINETSTIRIEKHLRAIDSRKLDNIRFTITPQTNSVAVEPQVKPAQWEAFKSLGMSNAEISALEHYSTGDIQDALDYTEYRNQKTDIRKIKPYFLEALKSGFRLDDTQREELSVLRERSGYSAFKSTAKLAGTKIPDGFYESPECKQAMEATGAKEPSKLDFRYNIVKSAVKAFQNRMGSGS